MTTFDEDDDLTIIRVRDQYIDVTIRHGKTITKYNPPNSQLDQEMREESVPMDFIVRRITFHHGVPAEYYWTNPGPTIALTGGTAIAICSIEEWPALMKAESQNNGHALSPENPQPLAKHRSPFTHKHHTRNSRAKNN